VILNLVLNACEAMPEGGNIWIRTKRKNSQVIIEVEDQGVGIPRNIWRQFLSLFSLPKQKKEAPGWGFLSAMELSKATGEKLR